MFTSLQKLNEQIYISTDLCHDIINIIGSYTPEAHCYIALSTFEIQWINDYPINKLLFQKKALQLHLEHFIKQQELHNVDGFIETITIRLENVEHLIRTYNQIMTVFSIKPLEIINLNVSLFKANIQSQTIVDDPGPFGDGNAYKVDINLNYLNISIESQLINDWNYVLSITENLVSKNTSYQQHLTNYEKMDCDGFTIQYAHSAQGIILPIEYKKNLFYVQLQLIDRTQVGLVIRSDLYYKIENKDLPRNEIAVISNDGVLYVKYKEWNPLLDEFFIKHMDKSLVSELDKLGNKYGICLVCGGCKSECDIPWTLDEASLKGLL